MQVRGRMKNMTRNGIAGAILFLVIAYTACNEVTARRQVQTNLELHARIIGAPLRNMDRDSSRAYLAEITKDDFYEKLVITASNGTVFYSGKAQPFSSFPDRMFFRLGLIPFFNIQADVTYEGKVVGRIEATARIRAIYGDLYVGIVGVLLVMVAHLYLNLLGANRELGSRVRDRSAKLQISEERFAAFMAHLPGAAFLKDAAGRILFANRYFENVLGLKHWEGKTTSELFAGEQGRRMSADDQKVLAQGPLEIEQTMTDRDGAARVFDTVKFPIRMKGGTMLLGGVALDITRRKQAEETVRESEERFRSLIEHAPEAVFVESGGRFVFLNPRMLKLVGASKPEELLGTEYIKCVAPEFHEAIHDRSRFQRKTGMPVPMMEQEYLRLDGLRVPVEATAMVIRYQGCDARLVFVRDVTVRKRMEASLGINERRLSLAISATADAVWEWNVKTGQMYYSPRWYEMLGYAHEQFPMTVDAWMSLCHSEDRQPTLDAFQGPLAALQRNGYRAEYRMRHKDGSWRWILGRGNVVERDASGQPVLMSGTNTDITNRKQAEDALRRSEEKHRGLFNNAVEGIYQTTPGGVLLSANPALAAMCGYASPEEIIASIRDMARDLYVVPEQRAVFKRLIEEQGSVTDFECQLRRRDGGVIWASVNGRVVRDEDGKVHHYDGTVVDITGRKQAEHVLRRTNRELRTISDCNQVLVRAENEEKLLHDICYVICENAGYRMAWVGFAEHDEAQAVRPVASAGLDDDYIKSLCITWADTDHGQGPAGTAIRSGQTAVIQDIAKDPRTMPWRESALRHGHRSCIALPLKDDKARTFGSLTICSGEPDFFTGDETRLLEELADDLAFGITVLRTRVKHRQAEQEALKEKALSDTVINSMPDIFFMIDQQGRLLRWNDEFTRLSGITPQSADLRRQFDRIIDADRDTARAAIERVFAEGQASVEVSAATTSGIRCYHCIGRRLLVEGQFCVVASGYDVTERKRAEMLLRENEERFRNLANATFEGIVISENGRVIDANDQCLEMLGYKRTEILGRPVVELFVPEVRDFVARAVRENDESTYMQPFMRKDGTALDGEVRPRTVRLGNRTLRIAALRDITERKQTELYRTLSNEVLEILNQPADFADSIRRVLAVVKNRTGCDAAGIRLQDGEDFPYFVQDGFSSDFLCKENMLVARDSQGNPCRRSDGRIDLECTCGLVVSGKTDPSNPLFTPGGSAWTNNASALLETPANADPRLNPRNRCIHEGFASMALVPIRAKQQIIGLLHLGDRRKNRFALATIQALEGIAAHMGEALIRRRAEEAVRESEERYRLLADNADDFVLLNHVNGRRLYVSPSYYRVTGWTPEEFQSANWRTLIHPDDLPLVEKAHAANQAGETTHIEYRWRCKDGSWIWVDTHCKPVSGPDGRVEHMQLWSRDITERKRTEEALRLEEARLETLLRLSQMTGASQQELADFSLEEAVRLTNSQIGYLAFMNEDETVLTMYSWSKAAMQQCAMTDKPLVYPVTTAGLWGEAVRQRKPIITNDYAEPNPLKKGTPAGHVPIRRHMNIPVFDGDRIVAVAGVGNKEDLYGESDVRQLTLLMQGMWRLVQRRRVEEVLRESQVRFDQLAEQSRTVIWEVDAEGRYIYVSHVAKEAWGYQPEELVGKKYFYDLHPNEGREAFKTAMLAVFERKSQVKNFERPLQCKDGGNIWVSANAMPLLNSDNTLRCYRGSHTNITRRKLAEQRLQASEERYRGLVNTMTDVIYMVSPDGRIAFIGPQVQRYGFTAAELLHRSFDELIHPEDRASVMRGFRRTLATGEEMAGTFRVVTKDGGIVWFEEIGRPFRDSTGRIVNVSGMLRDVTGRKRAEEAQREAEAKYRAIFENAVDGIYRASADGTFLAVNSALTRILGCSSPEEVLTRSNTAKQSWKIARTVREKFRQQLQSQGMVGDFEYEVRRKDGSTRWISEQAKAVREPDGTMRFYEGVIRDITEHKRAEEERTRLTAAIEQAAEAIVITDAQGDIVYANPAFEKSSGYSVAEALGKNPRILKSGRQDEKYYQRMWETLMRGDVWHGHFMNKRKDGELYEEEVTISPVRDASGRIVNYIALKLDVTRETLLEQQLRQSQKMEAVGQLAGGVAHDFNNILTAFMMTLSRLQRKQDLDVIVQEGLQDLETGATRASTLTRQLLMFSRRSVLNVRRLDLNEVVADTLKMLRHLLGEHIDIDFEPTDKPPLIKADAGMMEQVLMNLAVNARDAMPKGGQLSITIETVKIHPAQAVVHPERRVGHFVCLSVADTGSGMDEATQKRIFEPFFTTKAMGKGTGLGLATVYGIVTQHRGWVEVQSQLGHGTTFRVFLPAAVSSSATKESEETQSIPTGKETILLVEDESELRKNLAHTLRVWGYRVFEAANGRHALAFWNSHSREIDLLLTDVVMPEGMMGLELAEKLRAEKPALKVIISSGYSAEMAAHGIKPAAGMVYLPKPYSATVLGQTVRKCLDAGRHLK